MARASPAVWESCRKRIARVVRVNSSQDYEFVIDFGSESI